MNKFFIEKAGLLSLSFLFMAFGASAQKFAKAANGVTVTTPWYNVRLDTKTGKIDFNFNQGVALKNTVAFVKEEQAGMVQSPDLLRHAYTIEEVTDNTGEGKRIVFIHDNSDSSFRLIQYITLYKEKPQILVGAVAEYQDHILSSHLISPLAILPQAGGKATITGSEPRFMDMPYDNDNWTKLLTVNWNDDVRTGTGYEFTALYNNTDLSGLVLGNLAHDFWKTGIGFRPGAQKGVLDSLVVYGGASTADNKDLPNEYGGHDGTHDLVEHGSMSGSKIFAPLIFLCAAQNTTAAFKTYGELNAQISGSLPWNKPAPFYWNSFGVEDVLGYRKIMMPPGVAKISDFLATLHNYNSHAPVLSIDSYDQGIYSTDVLKSIGQYAKKRNQQMGFYFIPFAIWTWKNTIDNSKLQHTDTYMRDVTLKDKNGKTIIYKDGDFGAYPLDPTHPATRERIIKELQKAKAIDAKFLKIDFLSAGALESSVRYNKNISSGLQGYNYGMKMLKHLIDSILGPDIFITHAISPTFPHQFAHARFLSTDIYSHFRDDMPAFPHHGGTAASMITNSHLGWMQGSLLPYTNLDVVIMKNFQKNAELSERDIKVRLFSLMTLGSILGDGSDYRDALAAARAKKYLDNKKVCDYFVAPKAFDPIKPADGLAENQQMSFYLPGKEVLFSMFNFDLKKEFVQDINRAALGLKPNTRYTIVDFLTGKEMGSIPATDTVIRFTTPPADAQMLKLVAGR